MNEMFAWCESLTSLDLSSFSTSNVIKMNSMFYDCKSLKKLDLTNFDFTHVKNKDKMFDGCSAEIIMKDKE